MMKKTLVIGSTVADVIVRVDHLPRTGEDLDIDAQTLSLGGCAYNVYHALSLFGAPALLFSPVGGGLYGDFVCRQLEQAGIRSAAPRVEEENGCCYCFVEPDGERTFLCHHGAEYRFERRWLQGVEPASYGGVYLCGLEVEEATGDVLIDRLTESPPPVLYFAPGPRLCFIRPEKMARILALHPVLHLNAAEAAQFTRADAPEDAAALLRGLTDADVVITLGAEGSYVLDSEGGFVVPGEAARVRDTIGAGDAHIGAIMACRAAGMSMRSSVAMAGKVAAAVVEQSGAELTREAWTKWRESHGC